MTTKIKSKGAQTSLKTGLNKDTLVISRRWSTCKETKRTINIPNLKITTGITTPTISETAQEALIPRSTSLLLHITGLVARLDQRKNTILERSYEYITRLEGSVLEKFLLYHIRWIWSMDILF